MLLVSSVNIPIHNRFVFACCVALPGIQCNIQCGWHSSLAFCAENVGNDMKKTKWVEAPGLSIHSLNSPSVWRDLRHTTQDITAHTTRTSTHTSTYMHKHRWRTQHGQAEHTHTPLGTSFPDDTHIHTLQYTISHTHTHHWAHLSPTTHTFTHCNTQSHTHTQKVHTCPHTHTITYTT